MRRIGVLLALLAACERRATPATAPVTAAHDAPSSVSPPAASITLGRELPGCAGRWWPLVDGAGWRWRVERAWVDGAGADQRTVAIRAAAVTALARAGGAPRYRIEGWPAPWTDALIAPITVEVAATTIRTVTPAVPAAVGPAAPAPRAGEEVSAWIELGVDAPRGDPERTVTAAAPGRPAMLALTWRTLADDLTLTLACDVGPVVLEYHHHGTREDLRAVRVGMVAGQ